MTRFTRILIAHCLLALALQAARKPMITVPAMSMSKAGGNVEAVHMLNGDVISGKFVKIDPEKGLIWEAANIKPALQIDPAGIDRVTFRGQSPAKASQSRILLNSGNELTGQLEFVDADKVVINSWYAGRLEFKRTAIKAIIPASVSSGRVTFSGPTASAGWVFGTAKNAGGQKGIPVPQGFFQGALPKKNALGGKFQLKANSLESTGSGAMVGRKVEFPAKAMIEFDVDWSTPGRNSSYFSLNVNLFTDNLKSPHNGSSYALKLSQTGANLSHQSKQNGDVMAERVGPNARVNLTGIGSRARFSLRANKKTRSFILSINGVQVANWKDKQPFAGKGDGLLFTSRSPYPVKISNIRISEWNGNLPVRYENTLGINKQDSVRLSNNDTITGSVIGFRDNQVNIKTSFAEVNIPLTRVSIIQFAQGNVQATKRPLKDMVNAKLRGHGSLDFKLKSWQDGKLKVESPDFGAATFDGSIVESITFNPHKKRISGSNSTLSKKEQKKLLRNKEKGNIVPLPQRVPRLDK
ncbi:MAG: hypothetical protein MK236_04930 [Pedosphaera sp.]|nr:hypothetical protein [Pedosphaera sp.]